MMIFGAFPDHRDGWGEVYVRLDLIVAFVVNPDPDPANAGSVRLELMFNGWCLPTGIREAAGSLEAASLSQRTAAYVAEQVSRSVQTQRTPPRVLVPGVG